MKKFFNILLVGVCAAFALCSCETMDPEKDFSDTPYGFWVVDKLEVEASVTINGNKTSTTNTTDYSSEYCRLRLDTSNIATLWFNLEVPDIETFSYDKSKGQIVFSESLDKGDNGKAIVLLGIYDVILEGDNMTLRQPEAAIDVNGYGVSQRATYYFHREPKNDEQPRDTEE